jgi:wyosine [tRNA(Phe)-imidazoG37] synthetase (radical SAM superfamily)
MLLELQKGIIYGPINSRRLGRSLGINVLPPDVKVCPFNCLYCQYGWTGLHTLHPGGEADLPSLKSIRDALGTALRSMRELPAYITFSGNGEPTIHPDFCDIVDEVIDIRNTLAPAAETALISNSSLIAERDIRDAVMKLDLPIMKLDCGAPETFRGYNQPCRGVSLERITEGMIALPDVTIQTLLSSGPAGNMDQASIEEWIDRLLRIKPSFVQLYTLARGYPTRKIRPASREELNRVKAQVVQAGIPVEVY